MGCTVSDTLMVRDQPAQKLLWDSLWQATQAGHPDPDSDQGTLVTAEFGRLAGSASPRRIEW